MTPEHMTTCKRRLSGSAYLHVLETILSDQLCGLSRAHSARQPYQHIPFSFQS